MGRLLSRVDQAGRTTRWSCDAAGQLTTVTNPGGGITRYSYDANGNLSSITDANNRLTSFLYDPLNRQSRKTWPDGSFEQSTYDAVGNRLSHRASDGQINTYTYDVMNRLRLATYFDGQTSAYDYTLIGARRTVTETRGVTRYQYDGRQRLASIVQPNGQTVSYGYTLGDRRASLTSPAGTITQLSGHNGRAEQVTDPAGGTTTFSYNGVGAKINRSITLPANAGSINTAYSYDVRNRLTGIQHQRLDSFGSPVATLASFNYTLDPAGNRTAMSEADGTTTSWSYDQADRLLSETWRNGVNVTQRASTFAYDPTGNRLSYGLTLTGTTTTYSYNNLDQLTTSSDGNTYTYDGRGNLTRISNGLATTTYTWDARDRLIGASLPGGVTVSFAYDHDGRRVAQTVNGVATNYLWDELSTYGDVIAEFNDANGLMATYTLGDTELVSQHRGSQTHAYLQDGLGSVRALSDLSGVMTDQYRFAAYGEMVARTGISANPFGFAGQTVDEFTKTMYLRARYYTPYTSRFHSRDHYFGSLRNTAELNRYGYAALNPVMRVDSTGLSATEYGTVITIPRSVEKVFWAAVITMMTMLLLKNIQLTLPDPFFDRPRPRDSDNCLPNGIMGDHHVYIGCDNTSGQVFYVGSTTDLERRQMQHDAQGRNFTIKEVGCCFSREVFQAHESLTYILLQSLGYRMQNRQVPLGSRNSCYTKRTAAALLTQPIVLPRLLQNLLRAPPPPKVVFPTP